MSTPTSNLVRQLVPYTKLHYFGNLFDLLVVVWSPNRNLLNFDFTYKPSYLPNALTFGDHTTDIEPKYLLL